MVKTYHCVAKGRVPGIYMSWSLASEQIHEYSGEIHAGFDEFDEAVEFMTSHDNFREENITVYGKRGGKYPLRDWIRQHKSSQEVTEHTRTSHTHTEDAGLDTSTSTSDAQLTINNHVLGYIAGYIHQRPRDLIRDVVSSQFSREDINSAKSLLWDKCGHLNIMDKFIRRVDSASREAVDAAVEDILNGIYKLYSVDCPPLFVIAAQDIHRLPRCEHTATE